MDREIQMQCCIWKRLVCWCWWGLR